MAISQLQIECKHHGRAPGVIMCDHLFDGCSRDWWPVAGEGQENFDWLCPDCLEASLEDSLELLRTICVYCVRDLQRLATHIHWPDEPETESRD